ncbi:ammonium transporter [Candidatus Persebacteraceae bacterium Df01]|jgi:ammonia channel protein AmtB|uniref:Ammonium transporter n=1 Tax=Candidatus Doriopsillibacter californiensis TaxID=2970740 RepID=A0ABT7QKE8_9GAMM|nr:ammonium transporter [Candidatus Persebacteraceae bacterium Df01]
MDSNINALTTVFTEFYYWVTVVFMFLIHVGFCMYEVGASRRRNHAHTLMKNTMLIPLITITFFFFGWWIYWAFPNGPFITGGVEWDAAAANAPWSENMSAHLGDRITGVFWAAFLLFSWTAASIVSGSVIERIRSGAFWILAVLIGSVMWIIDAAWGWSANGWMVKLLGYHDAYASGVIHAIAGGFALGVLVVLGPRIGKFSADGTPRDIPPHNTWFATVGLFLIYTGFWGFYAACNVPLISPEGIGGEVTGTTWTATNIYLAPTTLGAITFNFLMSLSGGLMAAYCVSKGDAFWTYSGGLAGVITASAGNDLYHPIQAMIVAAIGVVIAYKMHYWVERKYKIDDAVGAVAVHGYAGFIGLIIAGFLLWGAPSSPYEGYATINPLGQFLGAIIMFFVLGFLPAFIVSKILASFGMLRVPREIEIMGLDFSSEAAYQQAVDEIKRADHDEAAK